MNTLTQAIQSENIEMIMATCGLDASTLTNNRDGMQALIAALIAKHSTKK